MIPPREQWCIEVDVTSACQRRCSNCLRLSVAHRPEPWHMSVEQYAAALDAAAGFVKQPSDKKRRRRHIGMIGGEPLLHPKFLELCQVLEQKIPREHRAIFTGVKLDSHPFGAIVRRVFSYVNENLHNTNCFHQPVLVAPVDVVPDEAERREYISKCLLQEEWSSTFTPKGFFFCEVAGAFDAAFDGPGGMSVEPECWKHDLDHYNEQIERWCHRCGVCLPLPGRLDSEHVDDVSPTNLQALKDINSPRVARGQYAEVDESMLRSRAGWKPFAYLRDKA